MKIAVYNGFHFHYETIGHVLEYCNLRGHELVVYSKTEKNWGWFDHYGITPLSVEKYNHKDFDYVFLLTDDDWSFPVTPDEKVVCIEHTSYQRRSGNIKRITFSKSRPGVPFIFFTFSLPRTPKTLRVCVLGADKDVALKYPVEMVHFHRGNPVDTTEMMRVISSCQYMSCLNYKKPNSTPGAISMAFTCGCRLITTKNIIEKCGLKSAIDYDATDELVSMDPADVYEEAERMIKNRNDVYDSILVSPEDYDFIEIGTSDFETEIQDAGLKKGVSIEPVKRYLDALPNPPHVTKIHGAVSNRSGTIDVYSISPENIIKHNLPDWTRGCNSVNAPHKAYAGKVPDEIFTKDTVPVYTFTDIINMCHVKSCKYLKIDTEGHDAIILQSYVECVSKGFPLIPKIIFEDFGWSEKEDVDAILEKLVGYGYTWERTPCGGNIILVR